MLAGCASAPPPRDEACLQMLRDRGVAFVEGPALEGVRTPVTLAGESFTPRLRPRGRRPAQMDCQLAVALFNARPVFASVGVSELEYSAAYHYRNRRRSSQLSAHAFGLAIDVHRMRSERGDHDVARNYERRWGRWQSARPGPGWYRSCLGRPRTRAGRTLRQLACRLRLDEGFRLILTPDDNRDHRDHFHIEAWPDGPARFAAPAGQGPAQTLAVPQIAIPSPLSKWQEVGRGGGGGKEGGGGGGGGVGGVGGGKGGATRGGWGASARCRCRVRRSRPGLRRG